MLRQLFCGVAIAALSNCAAAAAPPVAKNVVIRAAVTRARLPLAAGALQSRTELILRDIRFDVHPGTQFNVFLERTGDPTKRARAGTLSFYAPAKAGGTINRTFDVTDELRQIAGTAGALKDVTIVFEATTGRGGAAEAPFDPQTKLTIGEITLRVKGK